MATVRAFIRTSKKGKNNAVAVRFRLSAGRATQLFHVSDIEVNPDYWDEANQKIKARVVIDEEERTKINTDVDKRKALLLELFSKLSGQTITPEIWETSINKVLNPDNYKPKEQTFFDIYDSFVKAKPKGQSVHLNVVKRSLQRWEIYRQITEKNTFAVKIDNLTNKDIQAFEAFLTDEHSFADKYPVIYETIKETRPPKPRGRNTISNILSRFRTFYIWAVKEEYTSNNPFLKYQIKEAVYGTPYYITVKERNMLAKFDLSNHPETAVQRDIFVFHCLIGCRVGDLYKLTENNLKNDGAFLEYIPRKTKEDKPVTVRVPLTQTAKDLINKYKGIDEKGRLFPYISTQKYNKQIKRMFKLSGITRIVTVLNPITGDGEQKPINEIASSHLARRAFIGNIYKKVKDPNLVGAMSGHVEGSKAFARYRDIDDEIKTELINLIV